MQRASQGVREADQPRARHREEVLGEDEDALARDRGQRRERAPFLADSGAVHGARGELDDRVGIQANQALGRQRGVEHRAGRHGILPARPQEKVMVDAVRSRRGQRAEASLMYAADADDHAWSGSSICAFVDATQKAFEFGHGGVGASARAAQVSGRRDAVEDPADAAMVELHDLDAERRQVSTGIHVLGQDDDQIRAQGDEGLVAGCEVTTDLRQGGGLGGVPAIARHADDAVTASGFEQDLRGARRQRDDALRGRERGS
jgi:hypothetical protein